MERPLVSIIVPVYRVEREIARCLESIRTQSWEKIEVLLANDGSPDHSLEICRQFAEQDSRFQVLDLPHRGVSATRNTAISRASGKYIQFVDGDDYLPSDATECLVRAANPPVQT